MGEVLFGIAQAILKNLGSTAVEEMASAWVFKARLKKLKDTITRIEKLMLDAEERQVHDERVRGWLEELSTAVYAADDLFDEVATVASREQLIQRNSVCKLLDCICLQDFFSSCNQIAFAFKISRKIKSIREELEEIDSNGKEFEFLRQSYDNLERGSVMSSWRRRDQTISFVREDRVIGRDADKKVVLDMLLNSSFTVISIVGIGGMGKTALAQLIYNDPQVEEYFELKLWVCVSDVFDIKAITEQILMSATNEETPKVGMEQLQGQLRKKIGDKKYLLVLDDVWNDNPKKWIELEDLLKDGRKGSKILVTTRSRKVAEAMGYVHIHNLQGLSEEKSWDLFVKRAFKYGDEVQQKSHLVEVGKEIIKKCANVPLAIISVGSLLYGEEERTWFSIRNILYGEEGRKWSSIRYKSLAKVSYDNQNDIVNILKLSYHHLWWPLKKCFAYCALFPKDYEFDIEKLICLWMAEGYITTDASSEGSQSLYEIGEDYFQTLVQRGFFQDLTKNDLGIITKCKMHDLVHDLAQEVAGSKFKVAKLAERNFDENIIHLSFAYRLTSTWEIPDGMLNLKMLRSFLLQEKRGDGSPFRESICHQLILRFRCLRVLDLHRLHLRSLPSSIGKLIHLRYLDLSDSSIEQLPDSIINLQNLQTLNLRGCSFLRTLPVEIRKLTNLRNLDVRCCFKLAEMPSGIGGLTLLNNLPIFIVHSKSSKSSNTAKLSDLNKLIHLRGELDIEIHRNIGEGMALEAKESYLADKQRLTDLKIFFHWPLFDWSDVEADDDIEIRNHDEAMLESLKPHSNLRKLFIFSYRGEKLPSWGCMDNFCHTLPNLVEIELSYCKSCQQIPVFSQLRFLKCLELQVMDRVKYMENGVCDHNSLSSSKSLFFPSLEKLVLKDMKKLKGWWKGSRQSYEHLQFCNLSRLSIEDCPSLISLPLCPKVEDLCLVGNHESFSLLTLATTSSTTTMWKLKTLEIDNVEYQLMSLPEQSLLQQLNSLTVKNDEKLESTERLGEVFASLSSSLRTLEFSECGKLRSISKGLEHLTALEHLELFECQNLDLSDGDEDGMPWKAFKTNLRSLSLGRLPKVVDLPSGFQHLANLCSLDLQHLPQLENLPSELQHLANLRDLFLNSIRQLKELPEWMSCLTSLESLIMDNCPKLTTLPEGFCNLTSLNELVIDDCGELTERCRRPNGSDCPKIQHVSFVSVRTKE